MESSGPASHDFSLFLYETYVGSFASPWPLGSVIWYCPYCNSEVAKRIALSSRNGWLHESFPCRDCSRKYSTAWANAKHSFPLGILQPQEKARGFHPAEIEAAELLISLDLYLGAIEHATERNASGTDDGVSRYILESLESCGLY